MNRGELSGDSAIDIVLRELDYQVKTKGNGFSYNFNGTIASKYLPRPEQENILRTLNNNGLIELRIESAQNSAIELLGEDEPHWIDLYIVESVSDESHTKTNAENATSHIYLARLSSREGNLLLSIDGGEYSIIGRQNDGQKSFQLINALFAKPPGVVIPSADIFNERLNLKQIITKNKLSYILPFLNENVFPYSIARKDEDIKLSSSDLKSLLSKLTEKYRNNFTAYL
jgi:hypothetical protein